MVKNTLSIHTHACEIEISLPKHTLPSISIYICPNATIFKLLSFLR